MALHEKDHRRKILKNLEKKEASQRHYPDLGVFMKREWLSRHAFVVPWQDSEADQQDKENENPQGMSRSYRQYLSQFYF